MADGGGSDAPREGVSTLHERRRNDDTVDKVVHEVTDLCARTALSETAAERREKETEVKARAAAAQ